MSALLLFLLLATPGLHLESLLKKHGWGEIVQDQNASKAASELARRIGQSRRGREPDALGQMVRFLLWRHGVGDTQIVPFIVRHKTQKELGDQMPRILSRLEKRLPPTHYGIGRYGADGEYTTVYILIHRGVRLVSPLPQRLEDEGQLVVRGALRRGYFRPRVIIALPDSQSIVEYPAWTDHRTVDAQVPLASGSGKYGFEIVADSQYGPVVLIQQPVFVKDVAPQLPVVRLRSGKRRASDAEEATQLLLAVNRLRIEHGLNLLEEDARLSRAAQQHASELAKKKSLQHTSPNSGNLEMRLRALDIHVIALAENLAEAADARAALEAFKKSPGHARNLLLADMTHAGIGRVGRYFALIVARFETGLNGRHEIQP